MKTIGDLLTRDLSRKIEEIIQVDQADEASVHAEISEYVATDSIRTQYHDLLKAVAEAPADPHESVGVWVSGFFGSGKSSFAKNLGYALENRSVLGSKFADLFKEQLGDSRISDLLDLINAKTPTEVILFEVAKEADTRKVTQRIAELMYTVLLRELGYAEDFDVAELEIELEAEGKLPEFIASCKTLLKKDWENVRAGRRRSPAPAPYCTSSTLEPTRPRIPGRMLSANATPRSRSARSWNARLSFGGDDGRGRLCVSSLTKWASTLPAAATRSKTCGQPSKSSEKSERTCSRLARSWRMLDRRHVPGKAR